VDQHLPAVHHHVGVGGEPSQPPLGAVFPDSFERRAGQQDRVAGMVSRAADAGAEVVVGGTTLDRGGFFYAPTVVANPAQDSEIVQREVFGPVVSVQRFAVGVKDLSAQVKEARAAGADVVISYTVGPEAAVLAKDIEKQKWAVQLMGSWPLCWRNFIDGAGSAGEGALMAVSFIQQASFQRRNAFITAYTQKYDSPTIPAPMAAAQGYDAALLLFYALHQAQSSAPAKVKEALENLKRPVSGVITTYDRPFSPKDHDAITDNMLVMGIVHMAVVVLEFVVHMFMLVALGKMEPQANCHEDAGSDQPQRHCIA